MQIQMHRDADPDAARVTDLDPEHPAMQIIFAVLDSGVEQGLTRQEVAATVLDALQTGPAETARIMAALEAAAAAKHAS